MKKIGILGWKIGQNSFGITLPYFRYLSNYGEIVILEPNSRIREDLDLLVLPGGPDLSPNLMDLDKFDIDIQKSCPIRTYFVQTRLQQYINAKIPLFGICLGHQMLATHVGCKLDTNMYHETNDPEERYKSVHGLLLNDNWKNGNNVKVNSIHHQAILLEDVKNVEVIATHKPRKNTRHDNHVEALKYNDFPGYSVQWHPEEINDAIANWMMKDLLNYKENISKKKKEEELLIKA